MTTPIAAAITPPPMIAARTGQPCSVANCAVASAPTPAKVIWQSQSMPPSPVTSVYERKTMASADAGGHQRPASTA